MRLKRMLEAMGRRAGASGRARPRPAGVVAVFLLAVVLPAMRGGEVAVTPSGSSPAEAFAALDRKGVTVVAVGCPSLVIPGDLRGRTVNAKDLVDAVALFHDLRAVWRADQAVVVLCPASGAVAAPVIDSAEAAWQAGRARDVRSIPGLVAAAQSADSELAWQASRALQRIGWAATLALGGEAAWTWRVAAADRAAYRGARPLVHKGPDYLAFLQAARECGTVAGQAPLALLGEAAGHWNRRVRVCALLAAAKLPANAALPLVDKALADPSRAVRAAAAEAAGRLGAVAQLEALLDDPSAEIRYRAVDALGAAGGEQAVTLLQRALGAADPVMRQHALSALTVSGGERSFRCVRDLAANRETVAALRRHAISCLGLAGGARALDLLADLLTESDVNIRRAAVKALAASGTGGLPLLAKAVADDDEQVALQALASVGGVGGPEAAGLLDKALKQSDEYLRAAAVRALGEIGGELALPSLRRALADPESLVRAGAAAALGLSGTTNAVPLLESVAADRDIGVRADVAMALAHFNAAGDRVWPLLAKLANDEEAYVRRKVIDAVASCGGSRSLALLAQAAVDSDRDVRMAAIAALGIAGGPAAVPQLRPLLDDADPGIRAAAIEALGDIGGPMASGEIEKILTGKPDAAIRNAALSAAVRIGGGKALAMLQGAIAGLETPPDSAIGAIGELGGVDGSLALAILEKALARGGRKSHFHHDELEAMGRLRGVERARVLAHLERYILNPDSNKGRMAAARGCGHLGGADCAALLARACDVQERLTDAAAPMSVRQELLTLVEAAEQVEAVGVLRKMVAAGAQMSAQRAQTGQAALLALNDYSSAQDVPALATLVGLPWSPDVPHINICFTAADSLGRIGGPLARDALIESLRNPKLDSRVRGSVIIALQDYFPGDAESGKAIAAAQRQ